MTLIKIDQNSATQWLAPQPVNGRIGVPADVALVCLESLPCTCTVLSLMVEDCNCQCLKGVRLRDVGYEPSRYTTLGASWRHFRRTLIEAAREYVRRMEQQAFAWKLVTPETHMLVYGPYVHRDRGDKGGRQVGENNAPHMLDFKIWAEFVQKYGRVTDVGPGRPEWALKYWAEVDREMEREARAEREAARDAARERAGVALGTAPAYIGPLVNFAVGA